jgi:hypothetical protein
MIEHAQIYWPLLTQASPHTLIIYLEFSFYLGRRRVVIFTSALSKREQLVQRQEQTVFSQRSKNRLERRVLTRKWEMIRDKLEKLSGG